MKRREFIGLFGVAAAWPFASLAQQPERIRRIGVLMPYAETDTEGGRRVAVFRQGLHELGWIEGRNIAIDYRWTAGDVNRIRVFTAELVNLAPDVILATNTPTMRALRQATQTIPIVFVAVSDPVGDGFVTSLARPGGNVTGFSNYDPNMVGKWLQLLKEIAPNARRIAVLFNPDTAPHSIFLPSLKAAARSFAMELLPTPVRDAAQIESAIAALGREPGRGLLAMPDSFMSIQRKLVTTLTVQHRVPAVYPFRFFATSGGLLSYGVDAVDQFQRAPTYLDRILRGAKPGELPVQEPTKFELVINLKTAKVLGLTVPSTLLARADEVIE